MDEKTDSTTRTIIEALDSHGENGCGIISLSLETGFSQNTLRNFFKDNKKYCLAIEKNKFRLNRGTEENGSIDKIITNIEREKAEQKIKDRVAKGFLWGFTLGLLSTSIGEWLFYLYEWLF